MKQISIVFFATVISWSAVSQVTNSMYELMLSSLYANTVPTVSVKQLKAMKKVALLDVRTDQEFKMSHLIGAVCYDYDSFMTDYVKGISKSDTVIVYCSVGYRSEKAGEELQKSGYTNVFNLYGGMFEWVNQDGEIINQNGMITDTVHAYSKSWGIWLTKGVKVYE